MTFINALDVDIRKTINVESMKAYADECSKTISIRSYDDNGNSNDNGRETTEEEAEIIRKIIYGALLNIREGGDIQATADTAEYIAMQFLPRDGLDAYDTRTNCYDTVYCPIKQWVRDRENET